MSHSALFKCLLFLPDVAFSDILICLLAVSLRTPPERQELCAPHPCVTRKYLQISYKHSIKEEDERLERREEGMERRRDRGKERVGVEEGKGERTKF